MSETGCTVTIDGSESGEYYVPCDMVQYFINGLINTSNTSVNLYKEVRHSNSNYDYISCRSYQYPVYYQSYNNSKELTDITTMTFNTRANFYLNRDYITLFVLFLVSLMALRAIFKRG